MKTCLLVVVIMAAAGLTTAQQQKFRSGIFLHHSTGLRIWGPNQSTTSVPLEIGKYNLVHALSGGNAVTLAELNWPPAPDNEWSRWRTIFDNADPGSDIRPILAANRIVMIKSCFPSSQVWGGMGSAADVLSPDLKSVYNYKWHWRTIVNAMRKLTGNFFVIWTNAPLAAGVTTREQAAFADKFCRWAKDTLARGLDPVLGAFPKNVYVYDFFHAVAGADGILPVKYAADSIDSHPNAAATQLAAPGLVREVFDAALAYERYLASATVPAGTSLPELYELKQNHPNPFNPSTTFTYGLPVKSRVKLEVFNALGQQVEAVVNGERAAGWHQETWSTLAPSGIYFYRLEAAGVNAPAKRYVQVRRMLLLK